MRKGLVNYKTAVIFSIPSLIAVFMTRKYLVPAIPTELLRLGGLAVSKNLGILLLFALLMIWAAVSMIRQDRATDETAELGFNYPLIFLEGLVVGLLTGLVGAGGGFLIIPALVLLAKLPMKMAVGTSLLIIAAKSLIGFTGDVGNLRIDWMFLGKFSLLAIFGIIVGTSISKYVSSAKLKPAFGWFVLVMGVGIVAKELLLK